MKQILKITKNAGTAKVNLSSKALGVFAAIVFVLGVGIGIAHAAFNVNAWQYMRTITVNSAAQSFGKIVLPKDISRTSQGFADVRIINQNGLETAYLITRNAEEHGATTQASLLDMSTKNGQTQFVADAGKNGLVHAAISFDTTTQNFRRQVKIYASHWPIAIDSTEWALVTDKAYIYKFTDPESGFVSGKNEVRFPASSAQFIKVVIGAGDEGAVAVAAATLRGDTTVDVPVSSKEVPVSVFNNTKKSTTEVVVDLGSSGNLTSAVTLSPTDENYSRRVVVESSDTNTASSTWNYVGAGSISSVKTTLFTGSSNRVQYAEQKTRYIRVSVINDDNRPLTIDQTVLIESPVISVVFETRTGETYHLYYGNPKAKTPVYDIAKLSSYIEANKIPAGFLGEELENPSFEAPAGPVVPFTEAHKWLLNVLLAVVVGVLGVVIVWYLWKFMKNQPETVDFKDFE